MTPDESRYSNVAFRARSHSNAEVIELHSWMFQHFQPYIKDRILEIGSGSGNFSSFLLQQGLSFHLSDSSKSNRENLRVRFLDIQGVKSIQLIDLTCKDFSETHAPLLGLFDTIIALNAPEQSLLDKISVGNIKRLLRPEGRLITLSIANTMLYNGIADDPETMKRYNRKVLKNFFGADIEILKTRYFTLEMPSPSQFSLQPVLLTLVIASKLAK